MFNHIKKITTYTLSNIVCLLSFLVLFFILDIDLLASFILTMVLGAILYSQSKRKRPNTTSEQKALEKVSGEKEAFYRNKGLTKDEMNLFRKTMHTAREQIYAIESNVNTRTKLKAITNRNNTVNILKDFFKHIAEQPERLHEVSSFLYTNLPNLKELTDHYLEIDDHVTKTKKTYQSLNQSAQTIDDMCKLIKEDYIAFMSNDLDNMEVEMELANHVLKRDNDHINVTEPSDNEI